MTPRGAIRRFRTGIYPSRGDDYSTPDAYLQFGPDGRLWFNEPQGGRIAGATLRWRAGRKTKRGGYCIRSYKGALVCPIRTKKYRDNDKLKPKNGEAARDRVWAGLRRIRDRWLTTTVQSSMRSRQIMRR